MSSKQVSKNIFFSGLTVFTSLSVIFLLIIAARSFSVEDFGKINFGISFARLFAFIFSYGFLGLSIREISKERKLAEKYLVNIQVLKLILIAVTFTLMVIILNLMNYNTEYQMVIYAFAFAHFITSLNATFRYVFRAYEKFQYETITLTIERVLIFLLGALFIHLQKGILYFAIAFLAGRVVGTIVAYIMSKRLGVNFENEFDLQFSKNLMVVAFPFAITTVLFSIYSAIDTFMLSILKNDVEVGIYNAAYRLLESSILVPSIIADAFYPRFSVEIKNSRDAVENLYGKSIKYMFIIACPVVAIILVLGPQILNLVYGEAYLSSLQNLQILFGAFLFLSIARLSKTLLDSIDKQKMSAYLFGLTVIVNILLNSFLIPRYASDGASMATFISEFVYFVSTIYILKRNGYKSHLFKNGIKPLVAAALIGAIIYTYSEVNIFLLIPVGMIIYFILLTLLQTWDEEEKSLLRLNKLFSRFRLKKA